MKKVDYLLVNETVLVAAAVKGKDVADYIGRVVSVNFAGDVLVEFPDLSRRSYHKSELLHLYPKRVIMQELVSNLDMADKNFRTILKVVRLLSDRKTKEALLLANSNVTVRDFCLIDCKKWEEFQISYREKNRRRIRY